MFEEAAPAGTVTSFHLHHNSDEVAYVLDGEITFKIGDQITVGGPGTVAFMPHGIAHAWKNTGAGTARVLFTFTPPEAGKLFEEQTRLGRPIISMGDREAVRSKRSSAAAVLARTTINPCLQRRCWGAVLPFGCHVRPTINPCLQPRRWGAVLPLGCCDSGRPSTHAYSRATGALCCRRPPTHAYSGAAGALCCRSATIINPCLQPRRWGAVLPLGWAARLVGWRGMPANNQSAIQISDSL